MNLDTCGCEKEVGGNHNLVKLRSKLLGEDILVTPDFKSQGMVDGTLVYTKGEIELLSHCNQEQVKAIHKVKECFEKSRVLKVQGVSSSETAQKILSVCLEYIGNRYPKGFMNVLEKKRPDIMNWIRETENKINDLITSLHREPDKTVFNEFLYKVDLLKKGWEKAFRLYKEGEI